MKVCTLNNAATSLLNIHLAGDFLFALQIILLPSVPPPYVQQGAMAMGGGAPQKIWGGRTMTLSIYAFLYLYVKSLDQRSRLLVGGHSHTAFSAVSPHSDNPFLPLPLQLGVATEACS